LVAAVVTDEDLTLFPEPAHAEQPPDPYAGLSTDARRTVRQAEALARGHHPLGLVFGPPAWRLHPEAAPAGDRRAPGRRCGNCTFRELVGWHNRTWPKCSYGDWEHASHSAATDVRAWWPACQNHLPDAPRRRR
jgi:hypothetical protein